MNIYTNKFLVAALSGACATTAVSADAGYIMEKSQEVRSQMKGTFTFGAAIRKLQEDLVTVFEETREAGWDGYDAVPVSQETYIAAYKFLECLPLGIELPSVGAEPDGSLEFEWYRNPKRLLSVSVTEEGVLYFASIIGPDRDRGSRVFCGGLPTRIAQLIGEVCAV